MIQDGNWAQISLVDNKAEEPSFKKTCRRADDLELEINQLGPSITIPNWRKVDLATREATAAPENAKTKVHVSKPESPSKREPMKGSPLTGF